MRLAVSVVLAAALAMAVGTQARADAAAGKAAFAAKKCDACHYTDGPAREKTISDQMAKKGPELWYAGSKFQNKWLNAWLQEPKPIRPLQYNTFKPNPGGHPKLAKGDAGAVTDFLMSLTSDVVEAGVIKPKKSAKGRLIFNKKMPCSGCHQYPARKKKIKGGLSGPTLVGVGKRLNPDWIYAYLKSPKVFKPVRAMPIFTGILGDRDMKKVAAYVANFK